MKEKNIASDMEQGVNEIIENAMEKLKNVIETNTIVGKPILLPENITILPISRINAGFVAGGGEIKCELKNRSNLSYPFSGGSGSGFTVTPVGFISICGKEVNYVAIEVKNSCTEIFNITNKIVDKILRDRKEENESNKE